MPATDPVMAVLDKLPLLGPPDVTSEVGRDASGTSPFGLRWAVSPVSPSDRHKKTYYTVTVKEATQVSRDGRVETVQDDVQKERED